MGWGSTFPVFINLISLNDPRIADFFFTAGYSPDQISRTFAIRTPTICAATKQV
jgi:hypothetical protein